MLHNKEIIKKIIIKAGVIAIWLLLWQLAAQKVDKFFFPPASTVLVRLCELVREPEFFAITGRSLWRIFAGCVPGIAIGTLLGALTACSRALYELLSPVLTVIKSTPVASFIILVLIWLKRDDVPSAIALLMVVPLLWSNVSSGIAKTDRRLVEMAKVYRFSFFKKLIRIYIPQVLPFFTAGCTTAVGFAWKAGIAAEVLAIPVSAIGTQLYYSKTNLEYTDLFAWTAAVIVLSLLFEKVLVFAIDKLTGKKEAAINGN